MNNEIKIKKPRSPNFPSLPLARTLELARSLLNKYARNSVHVIVGLRSLGYSHTGSSGMQVLASLIAYGLVDTEGSGEEKKIAISDLGFKILADNRAVSPEREEAIREAALNPPIFQKMLARYPHSLPADDALEWDLVSTFKFHKSSAIDFLKVFRQTLDYANLYQSGIIGDENQPLDWLPQTIEGDKPMINIPGQLESLPPMRTPTAALDTILTRAPEGEREIANYPIGQGLKARILVSGKSPLTQKAIEKLVALLNLNKEDLPEGDDEEKILS